MRALHQIAEQPDHVIAHRADRQALDRGLQPQRQPRALVHRFEQVAVLPLQLDVHLGAQQIGGARQLLRQRRLPLRGGGAGAHGRLHAPRQERGPARKSLDPALADDRKPHLHELVIGAAGAETERAGRRARFHLGGKIGQLVKQAVIVDELLGMAHFVGHFGEPRLDAVDRRRQPLRLRQAEQRQRAVGLHLDQPLHQGAGAPAAQSPVDHQDAHEARGIGLEIGGKQRVAVRVLRHRQAGAVEQLLERNLLFFLRHQMQVERHQHRARLRQRCHGRGQRGGRRMERHVALRGQLPGIGGKFGMLLPAQDRAAQLDAVLLGAVFERRQPAPGAEIGERRPVALGRLAGGGEGEMQHAARRLDRRERPGMHLAEHGGAQVMGGQPRAVADRHIRRHAYSGGM